MFMAHLRCDFKEPVLSGTRRLHCYATWIIVWRLAWLKRGALEFLDWTTGTLILFRTTEWIQAYLGSAESHAAKIKHTVITLEKTIGMIKRYLQLTNVMAAKQRARAHTVTRMTAKVSAGRPPNCHANTAANRYNTPTENPAATKRSQYVRLDPCTSKRIDRIEPRSASTPHVGSDWRKPSVCPIAKSSRRTAAIR